MTVDLRAQFLARQGYAVLKLDNRGSARRGLAFESAIAGNLGDLEVQDQVAGVRAVSRRHALDGRRVGVYGWSYGGYMTAMCMLRAPDVFSVGVAGAPVTDWDGYDTHYTERYMRTPAQNESGYQRSSALEYADSMRGELLLIHGMIDENVHFRHTVRLIDALIAARKQFQL
jgi:dipeptidyl-peptidase-4